MDELLNAIPDWGPVVSINLIATTDYDDEAVVHVACATCSTSGQRRPFVDWRRLPVTRAGRQHATRPVRSHRSPAVTAASRPGRVLTRPSGTTIWAGIVLGGIRPGTRTIPPWYRIRPDGGDAQRP